MIVATVEIDEMVVIVEIFEIVGTVKIAVVFVGIV